MFVFGLAAGFRDDAPNVERVRSLMDGFPLRATDGRQGACAPHAAAAVDRWGVVKRDAGVAPSWDPEHNLLFVGDVRLYNRRELAVDLHEPLSRLGECSDLELARLAYLRWGANAPNHLVGDFAFAAWDEKARTLLAARDHFGVRPLYYRFLPDGVVVASAIDQILTLVSRPLDEINHERIFDTFARRPRDVRQTYFRGIARVAPGCSIVIADGSLHETRYWKAPRPSSGRISYEENCERVRATFRRAVEDRLESDHPIVAHSSGGFDSSTILVVADDAYRREPGRAPLIMASAVAPGHACDESYYMDAVAARVSFEGIRWNVADDEPVPFPGVYRSAPRLRRGLGGGPRRDLDLAVERGARVMLSGVLGDGLWHATGVRRDMVRHGRWVETLRDVLRAARLGGTARRVVDAGLGLLPPATAMVIADRIFRRPTSPPNWLGPALRGLDPPKFSRLDLAKEDWESHLLCAVWARATSPEAAFTTEGFVESAAEVGAELRAPYADVRLAELVWQIPWQQREPRGHYRRTGRDALGPLLPPEFAKRIGQAPWTEVWVANARRSAWGLAPLIQRGPWLSAPFVDRAIARALLAMALAHGQTAPPQTYNHVLQFGALEAWLRSLLQ